METVMIGWPDGGNVAGKFAKALIDLIAWEAANPSPHYRVLEANHASSIYINENRNTLVRIAQAIKADWLFQIDSDESFKPQLLRQIFSTANAATRPIIVGLYANVANHNSVGEGSFDVVDCIYAEIRNGAYRNVRPPEDLRPFRVDAAGTGVMLTHLSVFERLPFPWFEIVYIEIAGQPEPQLMNEDISFCRKVREAGYDIWCNPLAEVTHWKTVPLVPSSLRHFFMKARKAEFAMSGGDDTMLPAVAKGYVENTIDGFMADEELHWLRERASRMSSVVEIGSWHGRSTSELLRACKGTVYAVDHFLGSPSERETNHRDAASAHEEFLRNVGDAPNLRLLKMPSVEAASHVEHADMVFIDGDHEHDAVMDDLRLWKPKAKRLLCGHDRDLPGVASALAASGIDYAEGPGTIWFAEVEG